MYRLCVNFDKKWVGLNFGRFSDKTHLVTLLKCHHGMNGAKSLGKMSSFYSPGFDNYRPPCALKIFNADSV
jgi:hypothetical protein